MSRFYSDDPDIDFLRWDEYQTQRAERFRAACVKCELCHRPIDPNDDSSCIKIGDDDGFCHVRCFIDAVDKSNIPYVLKEHIEWCVEAESYTSTPIPEV